MILGGIEQKTDEKLEALSPFYAALYYHPLMHSEDLKLQVCVFALTCMM